MRLISTIQTVGDLTDSLIFQTKEEKAEYIARLPEMRRKIEDKIASKRREAYNAYISALPERIQVKKQYDLYSQAARDQMRRIPKTSDGVINIYRTPEGAKYLEYDRLADIEMQKLKDISARVYALPFDVIEAENKKNYVFDQFTERYIPKSEAEAKAAALNAKFAAHTQKLAEDAASGAAQRRAFEERMAPASASIPDSAPITPQIPAANAAPGTTAVPTTSEVAPDSTPGKTSPLTFAAIGLVALKLLAII